LLNTIPGVDKDGAIGIISEIGIGYVSFSGSEAFGKLGRDESRGE
jgi:hypothetical protein